MSRNPLQQRLISIVEPVCVAAGYELVDLQFALEQGGWILRVNIDLPLVERADQIELAEVPVDRVDLSDCETVNRELSTVLDVEDPIPQAYSLEVSSPGIDRPLRTARDFAHFAGSDVKLQLGVALATESGERRNIRGILRGVDSNDRILLDVDGQRFELPLADVDTARLVPDWDAVMRGKSGVGPRLPTPIKSGHRPSKKPKPRGPDEGPSKND